MVGWQPYVFVEMMLMVYGLDPAEPEMQLGDINIEFTMDDGENENRGEQGQENAARRCNEERSMVS